MKKFFLLSLILCSVLIANASVSIQTAEGWLESAFVEWTASDSYSDYNVYVRPQGGNYTALDKQLLRNYGTYFRADALGLPAGNYQLKVVPIAKGAELAGEAKETDILSVRAHDRNGFAHFNWKNGVGAYKDNGELKDNARVVYVYKGNAKTVSLDMVVSDKGAVETRTGIQQIIQAYEKGRETRPLCVRILGTLEASDMDKFESKEEGLQIKGKNADSELNITIEGVGNDAVIRGFGILVRNSKSVELRNFAIMTAMDDCISLDTDNSNIWVHHLDGFYGKNGGGDKAKGDGTIDVKSDSKYVTISNNHFWDTGKSTMCGMKSESGPNYITYHHNWFDHSDSRHPRVRTMSVHVYNNYFDGVAKYCVGSTTSSSVFVEANYFNNCSKPMLISMQGSDTKNGTAEADGTFSSENGGIIKAYNNVFGGTRAKTLVYYSQTNNVHFDAYLAQSRTEQVPSTVKAKQGGGTYNNFDTNSSVMPAITPDDPNDIPAIVTGAYGAGRMFHGDIEFSLADFDPANYEISSVLSSVITGYSSKLQGIFGTDDIPVTAGITANPNAIAIGDAYCGVEQNKEFLLTGYSLQPADGTVALSATASLQLSLDKVNYASTANATYSGGSLSLKVYVRANYTTTGEQLDTIYATSGEHKIAVPVSANAISPEGGDGEQVSATWAIDALPVPEAVVVGPISAELTMQHMMAADTKSEFSDAGKTDITMVRFHNANDAGEKTAWPGGEIDENATRYIDFAITALGTTQIRITGISMDIASHSTSTMCYHINTGFGDGFTGVQTVAEAVNMTNKAIEHLALTPSITIPAGQTLHVRVLPWHNHSDAKSGKYICLKNVKIVGQTIEPITDVEAISDQQSVGGVQKVIRDGQLIILRDGIEYTIFGQKR